jgi:release factor glutamine methyltransferase
MFATLTPTFNIKAGEDGLDDIRHIVRWAPTHLNENGWLLLEHGYDQAAQVRALMATQNLTDIETHQDLAGNDRVTVGKKGP